MSKKGGGISFNTLLKGMKCPKGHTVGRVTFSIDPARKSNIAIPRMLYCPKCDIMFEVVLVEIKSKVFDKK